MKSVAEHAGGIDQTPMVFMIAQSGTVITNTVIFIPTIQGTKNTAWITKRGKAWTVSADKT